MVWLIPHFDGAGEAVCLNRSSVESILHRFDSGRSSCTKKSKYVKPIKWHAIRKVNDNSCLVPRWLRSPLPSPQLAWRLSKRCLHRMVELPNTREAGTRGNLLGRKICFHDEVSCHLHAMRPRNFERRCAEMPFEEPPQVP
jgi:hypothetical protein